MFESSRRQFLVRAMSAGGAALLAPSLRAVTRVSSPENGQVQPATRLDAGWHYRQGQLEGIWEVWRKEEADLWQPVRLPHCFNHADACDPDRAYYQGQGWYRTTVTVANPFEGGRTILHFQGAGQTSSLWVGSTFIGTHKGGYDEFVFDITEAVSTLRMTKGGVASTIPVAVLCDNGPDPERVPSELSDFCLYGGLYRHVNLVYLPALALDNVHILPTVRADGSANVSIRCRLYNPRTLSSLCKLSVDVLDPQGRSIHQWSGSMPPWSDSNELASTAISNPQLWSPETPALYRCRVTLSGPSGTSSMEERFGVRHVEFIEHGPFMLNGKRVLLQGTHRHADQAGVAAAMSDEQVRAEMHLIREMGANFIRLAHYQQDRLVLDLCDELGLMVWEEVPWCRAGVGDAAFQQNAKDMLYHMIEQHFNHPAVILWGLGNEDDWPDEYPSFDHAAIRAFMTELRDLAHRLDDSRLTSFRRCDFARDIPDVYSPSIWAGWYGGNYREYEGSLLKQRDRVKRFIHMEWGADSQAGRHSEDPEAVLRRVPTGKGTEERGLAYLNEGGSIRVSKDGDWSETYACNLFDWHLKTQEKLDWLTGSAQWIFKDFASPLRADDGIPNVNQKGVVQRDLRLKESYFVFQSYWSKKPMVHLYGHSWPIRWGKPDEPRIVKVYSNCERAELFLNGASQGVKKRDSQDFPAAGLRWDVTFRSGKNHLRVVAQIGEVTLQDELDLTYQTDPWGAPAELRLVQMPGKDGRVSVAASLYDAANVLCLDARNQVRFSLAGEGKLIDNMGTTHGSRVLQLTNGTASISVDTGSDSTTAKSASCVVGITAEGLPPAFVTISSGTNPGSLK
jgi:beta-galactosidase